MAYKSLGVLVPALFLLFWAFGIPAAAQLFLPSKCREICSNMPIQDVGDAADAFFIIDKRGNSSTAFSATRVSIWAVVLLKTLRMAVPPPVNQTVVLTPPAVARLLGAYSLAVYQSYAVWSEYLYGYGRFFAPLTPDMVNLAEPSRAGIWTALCAPSEDLFPGNFAPAERDVGAAQDAAISGAAYAFIELFFCNSTTTPYWCNGAGNITGARGNLEAAMTAVGLEDRDRFPAAWRQGAQIAEEVFRQLRVADLLRDNNSTLPANIATIPPSQPTPAVHQCSNLHRGWWHWQRLTVPRSRAVFTPNVSSPVFPPPSYASMPAAQTATPIFRGFAAQMFGPVLRSTSESQEMLLTGLTGPPGQSDPAGFQAAMMEVLATSATLDDGKKVIAEFWADGPESTTPPGHWYKIALEESNVNADFAIKSLNLVDRSIWATLNVGLALHEAGVLAWRLKLRYNGSRPITGIQCGLGQNAALGTDRWNTAWRGPYLGVGPRNRTNWQPFQALDFVTPPFPGYVSGHAAFSASAAEALRQLRSGFITKFTAPGYNCYRTSRGKSFVEPRRVAGESGYVAGVTDRPNRGPRSIGFSPARDVILCWLTYEEAAQQAADSRIYGGIHIRIDNDDGLKLGKRIGENVAASLARLSPPNFLTKSPVSYRSPLVGNPSVQTRPQEDMLCPPGTFLNVMDVWADQQGLYSLALYCSDGTFIGSQGYAGVGGTLSFFSTVTAGFFGLTAGVQDGSVVSLSMTTLDGSTTPTFGVPNTEQFPVYCYDGDRVVGLTFRDNGRIGNLGAIGLLCANSPVDTTYRTDQVPSVFNPPFSDWYYDHQCPEGTYITRFFGKAGHYVSTLTAQCARSWNLRDVGIPFYAPATDRPFSHTSLSGYRGVLVKSFTGGLDCIQFVNATGGLSPIYGTPGVPGQAISLSCIPGDLIVGYFGWANAYVATIGIICGSGPFSPITTNLRTLRRMRNPRHIGRIPGGYIVSESVARAKPMSAVLPQTRIPTFVVGTARRMSADGTNVLNTTNSINAAPYLPTPAVDTKVAVAAAVQTVNSSELYGFTEDPTQQSNTSFNPAQSTTLPQIHSNATTLSNGSSWHPQAEGTGLAADGLAGPAAHDNIAPSHKPVQQVDSITDNATAIHPDVQPTMPDQANISHEQAPTGKQRDASSSVYQRGSVILEQAASSHQP